MAVGIGTTDPLPIVSRPAVSSRRPCSSSAALTENLGAGGRSMLSGACVPAAAKPIPYPLTTAALVPPKDSRDTRL